MFIQFMEKTEPQTRGSVLGPSLPERRSGAGASAEEGNAAGEEKDAVTI